MFGHIRWCRLCAECYSNPREKILSKKLNQTGRFWRQSLYPKYSCSRNLYSILFSYVFSNRVDGSRYGNKITVCLTIFNISNKVFQYTNRGNRKAQPRLAVSFCYYLMLSRQSMG